jgi:hypothetical protein
MDQETDALRRPSSRARLALAPPCASTLASSLAANPTQQEAGVVDTHHSHAWRGKERQYGFEKAAKHRLSVGINGR